VETTRGFAANLLIPRHGILMNTDCSGRVLHAPDAIILFFSQIISVDTYFIFFDIFILSTYLVLDFHYKVMQ
jgi:hypothetical protein